MGVNFSFGQESQVPQILSSIGDQIDKQKKEAQDRASLFKSLQQYAETTGIADKNSTTPMGLAQLQGLVEGTMAKKHFAQMQQDQDIGKVRLDTLRANLANTQARNLPGFNADMTRLVQPVPGAGGPADDNPFTPPSTSVPELTLENLMGVASKNNMADDPGVIALGHYIGAQATSRAMNEERLAARAAASADMTPTIFEDPETGERKVLFGKTMSSSGINPAKRSTASSPQYGEDGELIGYSVPIGGGKNRFTPVKAPANGALLPVLDPATKKPVAGMGMDASGKVHDWRTERDKMRGPAPEPSPDSYEGQLKALGLTDEQVAAATAQAATAGGPSAAGPAPKRGPAIKPPVGTIQGGYKYNGKYPPNDKRAWDRL